MNEEFRETIRRIRTATLRIPELVLLNRKFEASMAVTQLKEDVAVFVKYMCALPPGQYDEKANDASTTVSDNEP